MFVWFQDAARSQEALLAGEAFAANAMLSVRALKESTFEEAPGHWIAPTIVYFHGSDCCGEPKASLRIERLAREVGEYGQVARVNLMLNQELAIRFRIGTQLEVLMMFSVSSGRLEGMMNSSESYEAIAAWVEPYVGAWRRRMTNPQKRAEVELIRQRTRAAKDAVRPQS